jgi:phosphoesterase RecJ-like protein
MLEQEGLGKDALEGLINYPRSIKGVAVALLFKEESPEAVRVSLRSKGDVNVAAVAEAFQGGGHKNAAGCTVRERVLGEIRRVVTAMGGESADGKG